MDIAWWYWVASLLITVIFAIICGMLADRKGYSAILFGILGFFFSLITLIVVLVLPDKTRR